MEQARFVGEDHACHYRTRLAVDDTTDGLDGTFLVVDGIVVQTPVSYTHLDVYKRQLPGQPFLHI